MLADAVDAGNGGIVDRGQFPRQRLGLDLDDIVTAMGDLDAGLYRLARSDERRTDLAAIPPQGDLDASPCRRAGIDDAIGDHLIGADQTEAGGILDGDASVNFPVMARQQHMNRCIEPQRGAGLRHIVNLPVGQKNDAADPVGRHVGQRLPQCLEGAGAIRLQPVALDADGDFAQVDMVQAGELGGKGGAGGFGLGGAGGEGLALAAIGHQCHDGRERLAVFPDDRGIEEGGEEEQRGQRPPRRAGQAADERQSDRRQQEQRAKADQPEREEGREIERPAHVIAPAVRGGREHAPDPTCNCRSVCTSRY